MIFAITLYTLIPAAFKINTYLNDKKAERDKAYYAYKAREAQER